MSLNKCRNLSSLLIALACGFTWTLVTARADIITDIDQLEKEKPEASKAKKQGPVTLEATPPSVPPKDLEKEKAEVEAAIAPSTAPQLIPEPIGGLIVPPSVAKPPAKGVGSKISGKRKEERQKSPVHLQSDGTSTYSKDFSTVVLQKNVVITQVDMRLASDEAKVALLPNGGAESGVKTAILSGKVAISRYSEDPSERMNAKSDKAVFDNLQQTIALEGNARLWREGSLIKGDRILYEITTGVIRVDKAQGVVQPERIKQ